MFFCTQQLGYQLQQLLYLFPFLRRVLVNNIFRHLHIPHELACNFLSVFSRIEYALKSTGFAIGDNKSVEPAWDIFANEIDEKLFQTTPINKLYRNFSEYMEIEEKYDTKSTFFFRTQYENGDYRDYRDDIKQLKKEGWEIGLHTDPSSIDEILKIKKEKENLEKKSSFGRELLLQKFEFLV